jgi:predicted acetyltransferase
MALIYRPVEAHELDALEALLGPALHFPDGMMREFISANIGIEHMRVIQDGEAIIAGVGAFPLGQWFGGSCVKSAAITAVGVAPHYRGAGIGAMLLRENLAELRAQGTLLAVLFPATLSYYRGAGYERAGNRITYELPVGLIDVRGESDLALVPFDSSGYEQAKALYQQRANTTTGQLERTEWLWRRRLEPKGKTSFRFFAMRNGVAEGYIVYNTAGRQDYITITDVVALTPAAGRRFLRLLADYRSMVELAAWVGGPSDPLVHLLAENLTGGSKQRVGIHTSYDWMLRIVDVIGALTSRGYPHGITAQLELALHDEILPENAGNYRFVVQNGHAEVTRSGTGQIQLGIRDLAALYSGYYTPAELTSIGTIAGPARDLELLGAVFAGARPWMADIF